MLYVAYSVIKDSPTVVCMRCAENAIYNYKLSGAIRVMTAKTACDSCSNTLKFETDQ